MKGVYCLVIILDKGWKIKIGRKYLQFKKGYYCYVGSALNSLEKRIERHKRKAKKKFWHIDYFLKYGKIIDAVIIKTHKKIECRLAEKVKRLSDQVIAGFGSSDCNCEGHLFYFGDVKKIDSIYEIKIK